MVFLPKQVWDKLWTELVDEMPHLSQALLAVRGPIWQKLEKLQQGGSRGQGKGPRPPKKTGGNGPKRPATEGIPVHEVIGLIGGSTPKKSKKMPEARAAASSYGDASAVKPPPKVAKKAGYVIHVAKSLKPLGFLAMPWDCTVTTVHKDDHDGRPLMVIATSEEEYAAIRADYHQPTEVRIVAVNYRDPLADVEIEISIPTDKTPKAEKIAEATAPLVSWKPAPGPRQNAYVPRPFVPKPPPIPGVSTLANKRASPGPPPTTTTKRGKPAEKVGLVVHLLPGVPNGRMVLKMDETLSRNYSPKYETRLVLLVSTTKNQLIAGRESYQKKGLPAICLNFDGEDDDLRLDTDIDADFKILFSVIYAKIKEMQDSGLYGLEPNTSGPSIRSLLVCLLFFE